MKLICPLSGMTWEAEGFATGHKIHTLAHPIFAMPVKTLYARFDADWYAGRLSKEEKKLIFLAIFNASGHVNFNYPADPSEAIVETHITALAKAVSWLLSIKHPGIAAPTFSINKETHKLENMSALLNAWHEAKDSFESGCKAQNLLAKKNRLEMLLESKIKRVEAGIVSESASYLNILANWAEVATDFPTFATIHPNTGASIHINNYWKELIACQEASIYSYPLSDWKELEDHIIDYLDDTDSSFAFTLLRRLKKVLHKQSDDIGAVVLCTTNSDGKASYSLTSSNKDKEAMQAIAAKAPTSEPIRGNYSSQVDFIKAKIAWNMAKKVANFPVEPKKATITVDGPEVSANDL